MKKKKGWLKSFEKVETMPFGKGHIIFLRKSMKK